MEMIKDSKSIHSYDVFLGGSCNPTTWRKDLAIPYLQEAGVSFYNPQVDHWSQDLIETEHAAKENAIVLFFVIDSQTRNVVTSIETANFASSRTNMILVIHPQNAEIGLEVAGEQVSDKELEDLKGAQKILHRIFSYQGILVFDNIPHALIKAIEILKNGTDQNSHSTCEEHTMNSKIRVVFDKFDVNKCGKIDVFDMRIAIQLLANQNLAVNKVLNLQIFEPNESYDIRNDLKMYLTFDQFYSIAFKYLSPTSSRSRRNTYNKEFTCCSKIGRSLYLQNKIIETSSNITDIYLFGENGDDNQWREDIAIPMIKKSNLSYYSSAETDFLVLLNARTLLFVIPNKSRSLATMILAAFCLSKGCNMVICIQNLSKDNCIIHGEKLTETAINDYNRGRAYLADLASREGVLVFQSITKAIEITIQKCL